MSRIGKNPVIVPSGVDVTIDGQCVTVKGKLGQLDVTLADLVLLSKEDDKIWVRPNGKTKSARQMWGTAKSLIQSLVIGVSEGFLVRLEINGVGYRAKMEGKDLVLQLGYSHEVRHPIAEGVTVKCKKPTLIEVSGTDKQRVGQVASEIRAFRPPEPYKGKGVRYENEIIVRKEGKKK
ncbi:MAG: 50S ribosomal protein L6 [Rhodospirillaceae bacterium]|nr:MAG: 50S ribosomal protein L6 [Rhodospirillaceae bacterium]